jgi:hypothetical protein
MRHLSAAALTVTIIGFVSIAEAQTGWTGTVATISAPVVTNGWLSIPAIAVEPNGNAYAIWNRVAGAPANTLIQASRYIAATNSWGPPMTLAGPAQFGTADVAVDGSGNAFFLMTRSVAGSSEIQVVRFVPISGTMTTATLSSNGVGAAFGEVVADAAGNAIVVWEEAAGVRSARYDSASATWGGSVQISAAGAVVPRLAIDGVNDITAIWRVLSAGQQIIQAARFDSTALNWGPVIDISLTGPASPFQTTRVAADSAGNVTAVWGQSNGNNTIIQSARFVKATGMWSSATDLSAPGANAEVSNVAADSAGNAIAIWRRASGSTYVIQTARFDAGSASWRTPVDLTAPTGLPYPLPQIKLDASGNAIALWAHSQIGLGIQIQASRYTATSNQWSALVALSAAGEAAGNPDFGFDAAGNGTAVWFQSAGGLGAIQTTRWIGPPPVAPDPPTDLVASVTGNTVTFAWKAPANGTPTGYVLEGGLSPGSVLASIPTGSAATTFTFNAPLGVFFVRVHAMSGNLRSAASNEIQLVVNPPPPPSAPAALLGMVNGSRLALSWTNTFQGGAPTALQLNVTGAHTATIPLAMSDTMSFDGVPGGTYSFTLTASNAGGVSPPSNAVTLTFPGSCSGPPGIPIDFTVAKSGSTLTLTWNPPVSGAAVTSYVIHASGTITTSLPTVARSVSGTVGPGTYALSVVAANDCGTSPPTDVITVTVPGPPPTIPDLVVTGVVSGDGQLLGGARVEVRGESFRSNWRIDTHADATGRYRVERNVSFPTRVWVTAYDARFTLQPCAVWFDYGASVKEERTADVSLTATPGASGAPPAPIPVRRSISGTVYTMTPQGRRSASGASVYFDLSDSDVQAWTTTDADGRFVLCGLPMDRPLQIVGSHQSLQAWLVVQPGGDADVELILK